MRWARVLSWPAALLIAAVVLAPSAHAGGPAPAPVLTITGSDAEVWSVARPTPVYTVRSTRTGTITWTLSGTTLTGAGPSPLRVELRNLRTGTYTLTATRTRPTATVRRIVRVDVTPPTIAIRAPAQGAAYLPGQAVEVDYSCAGAASCTGSLADGAMLPTDAGGPATFAVTALDPAGNSAAATVAYVVGPVAPTIVGRPADPVRGTRPVFSWTGGEPGATFTWQVLSEGTVISQGDTLDARVALGPLAPGAYAFQVRQTGASGRPGPFSVADPFTVARAVSAARLVPNTRNARLLSPRAGATTTRPRPLLSWRRHPGASLYNLQIFRVRGETLTKIVSRFPRGTRARVRGLRFGERYAWRVWPYVRRSGYTRLPLGMSFFDMSRPLRLSRGQMVVDRRIAQAALRRVNAIEGWLDAGIVAGDLRHEGLGAAAFDPALAPSGPASGGGTAAAAVRPLGVGGSAAAAAAPRGGIRVSARELLTTQRIAQAAVRHLAAIETRLAAGLTGGDIVDGSIGPEKLVPGLRLALPTATSTAVPPSTTPALRRTGHSARVRLRPRQLLITQRISQGAVKRAEALRERLLKGLSTEDFTPGSIGAADLAPSLRGR
jgi:hypothetical protein